MGMDIYTITMQKRHIPAKTIFPIIFRGENFTDRLTEGLREKSQKEWLVGKR